MTALTGDDAVVLKTSKYAAHGFLRDSQMVAYIAAGHAQIEFSGRTMAPGELLRQAKQKDGQALLGIVLPEQQQQFMAMPDFRAHDLENFMLDRRIFSSQLLKTFY